MKYQNIFILLLLPVLINSLPNCVTHNEDNSRCVECNPGFEGNIPGNAEYCQCNAPKRQVGSNQGIDICTNPIPNCDMHETLTTCWNCNYLSGWGPSDDRTSCEECTAEGYSIEKIEGGYRDCVKTITECDTYAADGSCIQCTGTWNSRKKLVNNSEGSQYCLQYDITSCLIYDSEETCQSCDEGKVPTYSRKRCEDCNSSGREIAVLDSGLTICAYTIPNCTKYASHSECQVCEGTKEYLNHRYSGKLCVEPITGCRRYENNQTDNLCYECEEPLSVSGDQKSCACENNKVPAEIYTPIGNRKDCIPRYIEGCVLYENDLMCKTCIEGMTAEYLGTYAYRPNKCECDEETKMYMRRENGTEQCELKTSEIQYCLVYNNDLGSCLQCDEGFTKSSDGSACNCETNLPRQIAYGRMACLQQEIVNCKEYVNETSCFTCNEGFDKNVDYTQCVGNGNTVTNPTDPVDSGNPTSPTDPVDSGNPSTPTDPIVDDSTDPTNPTDGTDPDTNLKDITDPNNDPNSPTAVGNRIIFQFGMILVCLLIFI